MGCPNLLANLLRALRMRFHPSSGQPQLEPLESRTLLSINPLAPAQIRQAYGFNLLDNTGAGQTIAIVEAYADPNIAGDVNTFDKAFSWSSGGHSLYAQFGSSASFLTTASPQGKTTANVGWAQETSLDVEWAHAIAPGAQILLVQAKSNSLDDLLSAVDYAANSGAQVVSMSWGTAEFAGETALDSHFLHPGVTFVASSGDGSEPLWPAVSPNVLAVGGTSLSVDASGNYQGETAWSASGGGVSAFEPKPSFQSGINQSATQRTSPDVAYDANPYTGLWVYDSYKGGGGWGIYGGTSAGAPQWAALIALANQSRGTPLSSADTLSAVYTLSSGPNSSAYFHDVTGGTTQANAAGPGYDLATGVGSPVANSLVAALSGSTTNAAQVQAAANSVAKLKSTDSRTVNRADQLLAAEVFLDSLQSRPAGTHSAVSQASTQTPPQPAFMTQTLPAVMPPRTLYWAGENIDSSTDDDGEELALKAATAAVPTYNVQLSVCYAETPVVEKRTWGEAVGTVCDKDFYEPKEMYPARPDEPVKKPVAPQKTKPLAAGFLMAGVTVAFGTPRHVPTKELTNDAWHYWRKWCRLPLRKRLTT